MKIKTLNHSLKIENWILKISEWLITIRRGLLDFSQTREISTPDSRETRLPAPEGAADGGQVTSKKPAADSLACPYCGSPEFVRRGLRAKKHEKVQLYLCKSCRKTFTPQITKGKHYPLSVMLDAISIYNLGYSLEETCRIVNFRANKPQQNSYFGSWSTSRQTRLGRLTVPSTQPKSESAGLGFTSEFSEAENSGESKKTASCEAAYVEGKFPSLLSARNLNDSGINLANPQLLSSGNLSSGNFETAKNQQPHADGDQKENTRQPSVIQNGKVKIADIHNANSSIVTANQEYINPIAKNFGNSIISTENEGAISTAPYQPEARFVNNPAKNFAKAGENDGFISSILHSAGNPVKFKVNSGGSEFPFVTEHASVVSRTLGSGNSGTPYRGSISPLASTFGGDGLSTFIISPKVSSATPLLDYQSKPSSAKLSSINSKEQNV